MLLVGYLIGSVPHQSRLLVHHAKRERNRPSDTVDFARSDLLYVPWDCRSVMYFMLYFKSLSSIFRFRLGALKIAMC